MNAEYKMEQDNLFNELLNFQSFNNIAIYQDSGTNCIEIETIRDINSEYLFFCWDVDRNSYFVSNCRKAFQIFVPIDSDQKQKIIELIKKFKEEISGNESSYSLNIVKNPETKIRTIDLKYNNVLLQRAHYSGGSRTSLSKHFLLNFIKNSYKANAIFFANKIKDGNFENLMICLQQEMAKSLNKFQ